MARQGGKLWNGFLPVFIWLSAVGLVVVLYVHRGQSFVVTGLAMSRTQTAAAIDDGILRQIAVELYQPVKRGDLLAVLEVGSPLQNDYTRALMEAQKNTAIAEMDRLQTELNAVRDKLALDMGIQGVAVLQTRRQLVMDVEQARIAVLQAKTMLEPDKVLLAGLELEKGALSKLMQKQAVEPYEYQKAELEYEQISRKVAQEQQLLEQAQADLQAAQRRLEECPAITTADTLLDTLVAPYAKAVQVQEKRLAELFVPMTRLQMTAPFDGIVSQLFCTEGQAVGAGQEIMVISQAAADSVVVWLDPAKAGQVAENKDVEVIRGTAPRAVIRTRVASVSPAIEQMPVQLWRNPATPQWGRPARILVPSEMHLLANEVVGVRGL